MCSSVAILFADNKVELSGKFTIDVDSIYGMMENNNACFVQQRV